MINDDFKIKYDLRIITPDYVAEQDGTEYTDIHLRDVIFADFLMEKKSLWVRLPDKYGANEFEDNPKHLMHLGIVEAVCNNMEYLDQKAKNFVFVDRTTPDQRFDKFIVDYVTNQKSAKKFSPIKGC